MKDELFTITLKIPEFPSRRRIYSDVVIYVVRERAQHKLIEGMSIDGENETVEYVREFLCWNAFKIKEVRKIVASIEKQFSHKSYPKMTIEACLVPSPLVSANNMTRCHCNDVFEFTKNGIQGVFELHSEDIIGSELVITCDHDGSIQFSNDSNKNLDSDFFNKIVKARKKAVSSGKTKTLSKIYISPKQECSSTDEEVPF